MKRSKHMGKIYMSIALALLLTITGGSAKADIITPPSYAECASALRNRNTTMVIICNGMPETISHLVEYLRDGNEYFSTAWDSAVVNGPIAFLTNSKEAIGRFDYFIVRELQMLDRQDLIAEWLKKHDAEKLITEINKR